MDAALPLVAQAVADDVVTPHIFQGRWGNTFWGITDTVDRFRIHLKRASISLVLGTAGEVHLGPEIMVLQTRGQLPHSHISLGTETSLPGY